MRIEGKVIEELDGERNYRIETPDGCEEVVSLPAPHEVTVGQVLASGSTEAGHRVWLENIPCPECRTDMFHGDELLICPVCQHREEPMDGTDFGIPDFSEVEVGDP